MPALFERLVQRLGRQGQPPRPSAAMRAATYPPPFPNGWYHLCDAEELRPGQVRYFECLGEQLVAFRAAEGGAVAVLDAFCPHLGANLANGRVAGDCIECPFHGWQLRGDGCVSRIPYAARPKGGLRTRAWPVREMHGMVFFYYAAGRGAGPEAVLPAFPLEPVEEIERGDMPCRGHYDAGTVDMHLIEFAENSVDFRHFGPLHGDMRLPFLGLRLPLLGVRHDVSWEPDPERPHIAYFQDQAMLRFRERDLPWSGARAQITFMGPGGVVLFTFDIPGLGRIQLVQTHLPVEPLKQRIRFRWFAERRLPRLLVYYVVGNWISQWRIDISIWEGKIYRPRPMLTQGDGPVHRMRRWFQQFYGAPVYAEPAASPAG